ncbi:hypothetical protein SAMN05216359_10696 [Roseateles sp. YR242]|uniref:hypothetical protein n=1 Tax=Roseateles sp. YR242 TaxID=1855305 RepID=UPI0008B3D058|nr:hypothetical protein [Roseateles sp. YR242]SEL19452.1 hypothetical protein SAMN05216359_10696 [Roseateles sp. YR242]
MNSRSKITTVAMAVALASGVGFLHAQSAGGGAQGSSGTTTARDRTNDPLSNNNDQLNKSMNNTNANNANNTNNVDRAAGQTSTSSQNNGNNNTTETWQDPNRGQTNMTGSTDTSRDNTLPARADRN